jgi:uncharacterized UPF0160 family protein
MHYHRITKYKQKTEGVKIGTEKEFKKAGTHNGRFHADEVMATAILKEIFDIELVRTRDEDTLKDLELVYDVGDGEFDHHQSDKEHRENGTPYAACGLIWRKFGKDVIKANDSSLSEEEVNGVFRYIDRNLIEAIDAEDNGIRSTVTIIPNLNVSTLISNFNPPWDANIEDEDSYFNEAVKFADIILGNALAHQISTIRAKTNIIEAYEKRPRPELLVLDRPYPWSRLLNSVDRNREVLFVVFPRENEYLLQTVRGGGGPLRNRKSLPAAWAGKRDEELNEIIGIDDAIFCHTGRFIAGAKSYDSIMKMADLAIAEPVEAPKRQFLKVLRKFISRQLKSVGLQ